MKERISIILTFLNVFVIGMLAGVLVFERLGIVSLSDGYSLSGYMWIGIIVPLFCDGRDLWNFLQDHEIH